MLTDYWCWDAVILLSLVILLLAWIIYCYVETTDELRSQLERQRVQSMSQIHSIDSKDVLVLENEVSKLQQLLENQQAEAEQLTMQLHIKSTKYKMVKQELNDLQQTKSSSVSVANQTYEDETDHSANSKQSHQSITKQVNQLLEHNKFLRLQIDNSVDQVVVKQLRDKLSEQESSSKEKDAKIKSLWKDLRSLEQECKTLKTKAYPESSDLIKLENQLKEKDAVINSKNLEISVFKTTLCDKNKQNEKLGIEINDLRFKLHDLNKAASQNKKSDNIISSLNEELSQVKNKVALFENISRNDEIGSLKSKVVNLNSEIKKLKDELIGKKSEVHALKEEIFNNTEQIRAKDKEINAIQKKAEDLMNVLTNKDIEISELRAFIDNYKREQRIDSNAFNDNLNKIQLLERKHSEKDAQIEQLLLQTAELSKLNEEIHLQDDDITKENKELMKKISIKNTEISELHMLNSNIKADCMKNEHEVEALQKSVNSLLGKIRTHEKIEMEKDSEIGMLLSEKSDLIETINQMSASKSMVDENEIVEDIITNQECSDLSTAPNASSLDEELYNFLIKFIELIGGNTQTIEGKPLNEVIEILDKLVRYRNRKIEENIRELEDENQTMSERIQNLLEKINHLYNLENDLREVKEHVMDIIRENYETYDENLAIVDLILQIKELIDGIKCEFAEIAEENAEMQNNSIELEGENESVNNEINELKDELNKYLKEIVILHDKNSEIEKEKIALERLHTELQLDIEHLHGEKAKQEKNINAFQEEITKLINEKELLKCQVDETYLQYTNSKQQLQNVEYGLTQIRKQLDKKLEEINVSKDFIADALLDKNIKFNNAASLIELTDMLIQCYHSVDMNKQQRKLNYIEQEMAEKDNDLFLSQKEVNTCKNIIIKIFGDNNWPINHNSTLNELALQLKQAISQRKQMSESTLYKESKSKNWTKLIKRKSKSRENLVGSQEIPVANEPGYLGNISAMSTEELKASIENLAIQNYDDMDELQHCLRSTLDCFNENLSEQMSVLSMARKIYLKVDEIKHSTNKGGDTFDGLLTDTYNKIEMDVHELAAAVHSSADKSLPLIQVSEIVVKDCIAYINDLLREVEKNKSMEDIHKLIKENKEQQNAIDQLKEELTKMLTICTESDANSSLLKKENTKLQSELANIRILINENNYKSENETLKNKISNLNEKMEYLESSIDAMSALEKKSAKKMSDLELELLELQREDEKNKILIDVLRKNGAKESPVKNDLEKQLRECKESLKKLEEDNLSITEELKGLINQNSTLIQSKKRLKDQCQGLQEETDSLRKVYNELLKNHESLMNNEQHSESKTSDDFTILQLELTRTKNDLKDALNKLANKSSSNDSSSDSLRRSLATAKAKSIGQSEMIKRLQFELEESYKSNESLDRLLKENKQLKERVEELEVNAQSQDNIVEIRYALQVLFAENKLHLDEDLSISELINVIGETLQKRPKQVSKKVHFGLTTTTLLDGSDQSLDKSKKYYTWPGSDDENDESRNVQDAFDEIESLKADIEYKDIAISQLTDKFEDVQEKLSNEQTQRGLIKKQLLEVLTKVESPQTFRLHANDNIDSVLLIQRLNASINDILEKKDVENSDLEKSNQELHHSVEDLTRKLYETNTEINRIKRSNISTFTNSSLLQTRSHSEERL